MMIHIWRNVLFDWKFPYYFCIFVFHMIHKHMKLCKNLVSFGTKIEAIWASGKTKSECKYPMILLKNVAFYPSFWGDSHFGRVFQNIDNCSGGLKIFKKLHMKSLRFASTKRIWKAIFIEETRRNVLRLCENFGFLRWKSTYKVYFLGRNAHSWFFTKPKTSRFFRAERRPFGAQRNRRLTENFAWFGSIQGLEINAQNRRRGVRFRSWVLPGKIGLFSV